MSSLLIIAVSVLLASVHFVSDLYSPTLFLLKASSQPLTLAVVLAIILFAIWSQNRMTLAAAAFACIIQVPFLMPNIAQKTMLDLSVGQQRFIVATFSTLTRTENVSDILAFIQSKKPDLLCLQELAQTDRKSLLLRLDGYYPYSLESDNNQLTLSRHVLTPLDTSGHSQASVLEHPTLGQINIINVHMPRPYLSDTLFNSWKQLFRLIDTAPRVILCGDLNITPNNSLYDVLRYDYGLDDSLTSGYGFTFPNAQRRSSLLGPLLRIDYIFTRGFSASNTRTVDASQASDHRAVLTELSPIEQ